MTIKLPNSPILHALKTQTPVFWYPEALPNNTEALKDVPFSQHDITDAADRLKRFAPFIQTAFPETASANGLIESPLLPLPSMQLALSNYYNLTLPGKLWGKADHSLPISGSVKARGGIYEVLHTAEEIALSAGLIKADSNYALLTSADARALFSEYEIAVGSTGNLGLSIGIMAAKLGFRTTVHMSADAREWKKQRLRASGVNVVEYAGDYSLAVANGRTQAEANPRCHFVDDEQSPQLFLGYAVAAQRLAAQLASANICVDEKHPLFVYLPCGVGGAPGGIAFGLKQLFGDHVHCLFAEPTPSPAMLLGVWSGLFDDISVNDIGLDNHTAADGLAVGRPSALVARTMHRLISGYYTATDDELFRLLALAYSTEQLHIEPSAAAAFAGFAHATNNPAFLQARNLTSDQLANSTHIAWLTGGSMVPDADFTHYVEHGQQLLTQSMESV